MFKRLAFAAMCLAASMAGSAQAADMPSSPSYTAPVAMSSFDWTGFYLGVSAGYHWTTDDFMDPIPPFVGVTSPDGFLGGIYGGYNWQLPSGWVFGVDTSFEFAAGNGESGPGTGAVVGYAEMNWQATLLGRVGYAFDRLLIYGTGGLAIADFDFNYHIGVPLDPFSDTMVGYTVGLGAEYAFTNNLIARLEWRYSDYGSAVGSIVNCCAAPPNNQTHEVTSQTTRLGIAYKF
ncbi:MAG: porin family protein [Rhodobiaceae bacterium]|nr:porin family protein [Rhodobiaceae bacterium]